MLMEGKISPLVDAVVGFDQLPEMLQRLANRQSKGRIVFAPGR
jgi:NADPH:quinone reductase-like Zn-dependent oxidoreductase